MFPFVIQMNEIVTERELKLRKALEAMGLHDTSYWISWHLFHTTMTLLFGFFIWLFGLIFQFALFKKNGARIPLTVRLLLSYPHLIFPEEHEVSFQILALCSLRSGSLANLWYVLAPRIFECNLVLVCFDRPF